MNFVGTKQLVKQYLPAVAREPAGLVERRLQLLESALEGTGHGAATRMATRLGISLQRWHNAKSGLGVSADLETILVERIPGLTIDWIRLGRRETLSYHMIEVLGLLNQRQDDRR